MDIPNRTSSGCRGPQTQIFNHKRSTSTRQAILFHQSMSTYHLSWLEVKLVNTRTALLYFSIATVYGTPTTTTVRGSLMVLQHMVVCCTYATEHTPAMLTPGNVPSLMVVRAQARLLALLLRAVVIWPKEAWWGRQIVVRCLKRLIAFWENVSMLTVRPSITPVLCGTHTSYHCF